jgi:predicted DNA-binding protein (UPF0251 family)
MVRPRRMRRICFTPNAVYFKPAGVPLRLLEEVVIRKDELEALRLQNLKGLGQEEAAKQMEISQPTFHRILQEARKKITDALINGKAIKIEK